MSDDSLSNTNVPEGEIITQEQGTSKRKSNICLYCKLEIDRPSRHFASHHKNEDRVRTILQIRCPKQRRAQFGDLIAEGNWAYNCEVLEKDKNIKLLCKRQFSQEIKPEDIIPCAFCKQLYSKKTIWKHFNKCSKNENPSANKRCAKRMGLLTLPPGFTCNRDTKKHILSRLREDDLKEILIKDELLLKFINTSVQNCFTQSAYKHLRARARALTRFLQVVRGVKNNQFLSFKEILDDLGSALLDSITIYSKKFKIFNNLEQLRADIIKIYEDSEVDEKNKTAKESLRTNLTNFKYYWKRIIRAKINYHKDTYERYRKLNLPTTEAVQTLYKHICVVLEQKLHETNDDYHEYRELCKYTIAKITIQNYRRGNEVGRMTMRDYENRSVYEEGKFEEYNLDNFEKIMGRVTEVVMLKGKSASHPSVAAILTPSCIQAVEKVKYLRNKFIPPENVHMFARAGLCLMHFEGPDMLREVQQAAGFAQDLTFTGLRKFCATRFSWMDLPEERRKLIYQHMGHTENINKSVYQVNADISKNTVIPTMLFQMLHDVKVPEAISEKDAEEFIFSKMIGFEVPSLESMEDEEISAEVPSLESMEDEEISAEVPSLQSMEDEEISAEPSTSFQTFVSPPPPTYPSQHSSSPLCTYTHNAIFTFVPLPHPNSTSSPSHISTPDATPTPPPNPPIILPQRPCRRSVNRKLFSSEVHNSNSTDDSRSESDGSSDEYSPTVKKKKFSPPKLQLRKLLKEKLQNKKTSQSPNKKKKKKNKKTTPKKKKTPLKYQIPGEDPRGSKRSWPPDIKAILAREFYIELRDKLPFQTSKLQLVQQKIRKVYPNFRPNPSTLRTFVSCNFPRTQTFAKYMEQAKHSLKK